jgi:tripartite-type tricarboxylate transporter receptor subunit TctC
MLLLGAWLVAMLAGCTGEDDTAAYPTRPVTLVVPFSAGGPTDVLARTLAGPMAQTLGQSVVVENKPGAGGTIAAAHVARAHADGYTLLIHHTGMATSKALYSKLTYDPSTSFEFVGQVVDVPMTLVGRQDLPPDTLQELIAYIAARRRPPARALSARAPASVVRPIARSRFATAPSAAWAGTGSSSSTRRKRASKA